MNVKDARLVKAFGYDTTRLYRHEGHTVERECRDGTVKLMLPTNTVLRAFVRGLEEELTQQAGLKHRDNKTLFIFDMPHSERYAVSFHDDTATFVSWSWHIHGGETATSLPANLVIPGGKL